MLPTLLPLILIASLFFSYKLLNPFNPNVRQAMRHSLNNFSLFNPFEPKGEHIFYIQPTKMTFKQAVEHHGFEFQQYCI